MLGHMTFHPARIEYRLGLINIVQEREQIDYLGPGLVIAIKKSLMTIIKLRRKYTVTHPQK